MRRAVGVLLSALLLVPVFLMSQAQAVPTFLAPKAMPQGSVIEPGVDIGPASLAAPGGTIIVNGPRGIPSGSGMWRSLDGGTNYSRLPVTTPFNRLPGGGDSDVVISESGRLYFLDLWAGSNSLARSDDGGTTFTFGTPLTTLPLSDRQWIALGGPGTLPGTDTVYIVSALIQAPQWVILSRSTDSGITWTTHKIAPAAGAATGFTGQIVSDNAGYVGFIYHQANQMRYAWSTDAGETWNISTIGLGALNTMPSVAKSGNTLHATWIRAADWSVMESHSTDLGATWSVPVDISGGGTNMFSWIDARDNKVAIAWYGAGGATKDPNTNAGPWFVKYSESLDLGVSYTTPINAAVAPAKTTPICTQGLGCDVGGAGNRELGDFMQLAIDRLGKSILVYVHVAGPNDYNVRAVKQAS